MVALGPTSAAKANRRVMRMSQDAAIRTVAGNYESKLKVMEKERENKLRASRLEALISPRQQELSEMIDYSKPNTITSQSFILSPKEQLTSRIHRNSVQRSTLLAATCPPVVPENNPKQQLLDKMATYQNKLDARLS